MPEQLESAPFAVIFGFFFAVAFVRTLVTYGIARIVAGQALDGTRSHNRVLARVHVWSLTPRARRATAFVHRWGVLAVPMSFCAVGTKTVVNAAAGLTRMPFTTRYLPALVAGCLIHATIYATVGWAAWTAALAAATGSVRVAVALGGFVLLTVLVVLHARRVRRSRATTETSES